LSHFLWDGFECDPERSTQFDERAVRDRTSPGSFEAPSLHGGVEAGG